MGQKYVEPPKVEISVSYEESAYFTPMLMLLSDGVEPPTASIQRLAAEKGKLIKLKKRTLYNCLSMHLF